MSKLSRLKLPGPALLYWPGVIFGQELHPTVPVGRRSSCSLFIHSFFHFKSGTSHITLLPDLQDATMTVANGSQTGLKVFTVRCT